MNINYHQWPLIIPLILASRYVLNINVHQCPLIFSLIFCTISIKSCHNNLKLSDKKIIVWLDFCIVGSFLCFAVPSFQHRCVIVTSPFVFRSFFDRSPFGLRFPNGAWTEVERSLNGARTEVERSSNGARTEVERSSNGGWTEDERRLNGARTEVERKIYHRNCWLNCDTVSVLMIFQELIKVDLGTFLLDDGLYNTLQKPSAYKDFTAECRTFSDVLLENHFVITTWESGRIWRRKKKLKLKF